MVGCRYQSPEYYLRCRNQRQGKHMCIHWFFPKSLWGKNWFSTEGRPIHFTTSHPPRRENSYQFWAAFKRSICEVHLRGGGYIVSTQLSRFRGQAPLSPAIRTLILSHLYQGRYRCRSHWNPPWGWVRLHKCLWEAHHYSHYGTWNRSCKPAWFIGIKEGFLNREPQHLPRLKKPQLQRYFAREQLIKASSFNLLTRILLSRCI